MEVNMNIVSIDDKIDMTVPSIINSMAVSVPCISQAVTSGDYDDLINKPAIDGNILIGDKTAEELGLYGNSNPETFVFEQKTPSNVWEIEHTLNKFPSCTVIDSANSVVIGNIEYVDNSHIIISFSGAFSGTALLN
jgi:hypothetical protein